VLARLLDGTLQGTAEGGKVVIQPGDTSIGPSHFDHTGHFVLSSDEARNVGQMLLHAAADVKAGDAYLNVQFICERAKANGPWRLVFSVTDGDKT